MIYIQRIKGTKKMCKPQNIINKKLINPPRQSLGWGWILGEEAETR